MEQLLVGMYFSLCLWLWGSERVVTLWCCSARMRVLTHHAVGFFDEVGERMYAANNVTELFNTPGMIGGEKHQYVLLA